MRGLTFRSRLRQADRGQVFIIVAGGMVALLGMLALAVDLGYWRDRQRLEQSAAKGNGGNDRDVTKGRRAYRRRHPKLRPVRHRPRRKTATPTMAA